MLNAVLDRELQKVERRRALRILCRIYASALLLIVLYFGFAVLMTAGHRFPGGSKVFFSGQFNIACWFFVQALLWLQWLALGLATPILVAGGITDEKASGTLQFLLATPLRSSEILLGKLLGGGYQLLLPVLTALPLFCLAASFLDISLPIMAGALYGQCLLILGVGGVSLLASVWCRTSRTAIVSVYVCEVLILLAVWGGHAWLMQQVATAASPSAASRWDAAALWLERIQACFDPTSLVGARLDGETAGQLTRRLLFMTLIWGGVGGICLVVASLRLRVAYARQLDGTAVAKKRRIAWARPAVTDDPICWKERYVEAILPLDWLQRGPRWVGLVLVAAASVAVFVFLHELYPRDDATHRGLRFAYPGFVVLSAAALVVAVRSSGAITRERERQTWEPLLLTSLRAREILDGKSRGIRAAIYPYLWAQAIPIAVLACLEGPLSVLWVGTWLAAAWLALGSANAMGLSNSLSASGSRRSLLDVLPQVCICAIPFSLGIPAICLNVELFIASLPPAMAWTPATMSRVTSELMVGGFGLIATLALLYLWRYCRRSAGVVVEAIEEARRPERERRQRRRAYPEVLPLQVLAIPVVRAVNKDRRRPRTD